MDSTARKEYLRRYREAHREERRRKGREYARTHREQRIEYNRKYRLENREKIMEYQTRPDRIESNRARAKRFREQNREYCKQRDKEYYEKNKAIRLIQDRERHRRWVKNNPEKSQERNKLNYLKRCNSERKPSQRLLYKTKRVQLDYYPRIGKCSLCGSSERRTHIHHIQYHDEDPLKDTIELCNKCHKMEHHRIRKEEVVK